MLSRDRVDSSEYAGDDATLIRQLRDADEHRAGQSGGFLWFFYRAPDDDSCVHELFATTVDPHVD